MHIIKHPNVVMYLNKTTYTRSKKLLFSPECIQTHHMLKSDFFFNCNGKKIYQVKPIKYYFYM